MNHRPLLADDVVLRAEGLVKNYNGTEALRGVSFELRRGSVLGILGPNGAGKTTALQIVLGILEADAGSVTIFGEPVDGRRHDLLARMNFSSAYTALPGNLTAAENLRVFAGLYGVPRWREKAALLLDLFRIGHLRDRLCGGFSSGEATRLNLVKALLNDPEILLLDEPTASLDPDIADQVRSALRRIQGERSMAVLYTSHNMREVEAVCDEILFLNKGRAIARGAPAEVLKGGPDRTLEEMFIRIARE